MSLQVMIVVVKVSCQEESVLPYCRGFCPRRGAGLCQLMRLCPHSSVYPPVESIRELSAVVKECCAEKKTVMS